MGTTIACAIGYLHSSFPHLRTTFDFLRSEMEILRKSPTVPS